MTHRFLPLALLLLCLAISCGKNEIEITPPEEPTPVEPVDPVDPPKTEEWTIDNDTSAPILGAVMLDVSGRNKEQEDMGDHSRNVYSARHIMEVAGMPFVSTKSLEQAMSQSRLILISSAVRANTFTPDELIRLRQWVEEGGALIAPAVTAISAEVEALFGISHSSYLKTRHYASWLDEVMTDAELAYMDEPEEKDFSLGGEKEEQVIKTYGYTLSTAHALARFNTGEVAVSRHTLGQGTVYSFGLLWRDVIQRPQLNKDFSAQRAYSNAFEPTADMFPLFVRATYCKHSPVAVWKSTIPDGYRTVLIPTHDCDSRTAYDAMHFMAEYEQSIGLSGQYFLTTHYYRDSPYLSAFYDQPSVEKSRQLLQLGQTIGSHSICHFPDFNKTDRFPLTEYTRQTYHATHNLETGITTDGSTWAEIVLSKHILEEDLGCTVKSFRSGHLCVNKNFPQALEMGEYGFSSCYGAGDVLTCFPYLERIGNEWVGRQSTVLQMPLHFSDVLYDDPMTEDNWHEKPARWLRLMEKLQGNFAPSMLLIHPNREWKMLSEKMLVEHMDRTTMGIYNFEDYGHFWLQRRQLQHTFAHNQAHDKIVIRATRAEFDANPHLSFVIHTATAQPPRQVVLIDEHSMALPLSVHTLSPGTYIAVRE